MKNRKTEVVGKLAMCCKGKVGIVKNKRTNKSGTYWEGVDIVNGGKWVSRKPLVLGTIESVSKTREKQQKTF